MDRDTHDLIHPDDEDIEIALPAVETDLIPKRRKASKAPPPRELNDRVRELLRKQVRFLYDIQKVRIQQGNRKGSEGAQLTDGDRDYLAQNTDYLISLETKVAKDLCKVLDGIPVWESFLKEVKGIGPRLGGVLLAEFDITRARTASSFIAYAGLDVDLETGKAVRKKKGEKLRHNPWLKSKVLEVLGGCLLKAKSEPWVKFYYGYRNRKENQKVAVCSLCKGEHKVTIKGRKGLHTCPNCKGGQAPWGNSKAHRHRAALRYMVKMFLTQFYTEWARVEGLPVRAPYAAEYLGRTHLNGVPMHQGGIQQVSMSEFMGAWADHCHMQPDEVMDFFSVE